MSDYREREQQEETSASTAVVRFIEFFNSIGFSLIIGGIVYFIIGSVASLVNSSMLDWTLCGSVHYWTHADWCSFGEAAPPHSLTYLMHRLLNIPLPWFMFFWGFVLTAVCSVILRFFPDPAAPLQIKREDRRL